SLSFFFNDTATTEIYTLSLHDALPIFDRASAQRGDGSPLARRRARPRRGRRGRALRRPRSFGPQPGRRREGLRPTPPQGRRAGALRRHLELSGGAALRTGAIR